MLATSISWGRKGKTEVPIFSAHNGSLLSHTKPSSFVFKVPPDPPSVRPAVFCFPPRRFSVVGISKVFIVGPAMNPFQSRVRPWGYTRPLLPVWSGEGARWRSPSSTRPTTPNPYPSLAPDRCAVLLSILLRLGLAHLVPYRWWRCPWKPLLHGATCTEDQELGSQVQPSCLAGPTSPLSPAATSPQGRAISLEKVKSLLSELRTGETDHVPHSSLAGKRKHLEGRSWCSVFTAKASAPGGCLAQEGAP